MRAILLTFAFTSLTLTAGIFGIFYGWVCTVMWGLDTAPPDVAIRAMQAMNASIRNAAFFPVFFLAPVFAGLTGLTAYFQGQTRAGMLFGVAALLCGLGIVLLTFTINVPMNENLAAISIPRDPVEATQIWATFSGTWQLWNQIRTGAGFLSVIAIGAGLMALARPVAG
ncbi:DUF1772 domain-containing protein [Actibacterium sp. 188UL27-1]|uniref:anthrone oxygenase family protein n=1 Tax=Actibacterium sp. 188UL27-1 TaxID=2786961 RepID=UPI0019590EE0|nr:DUF1772 domain-containing protein [Actibacterium sp. 188UL27-1]MBM7069436.1 DUF1772 domain-containing protein [Actibacterium sp. 188UL27-1]